ncbi:MAG: PEP/pyruvate-binding domain-containing protein, partial [Muribaculaceae bacterium]|nr:PEP/pyruvate-binding domain-containing protein [Muribaculaceae bacterium]
YPIALSDSPDDVILQAFLDASLPKRLLDDFRALFEVIDKPLAVRSSSLLEDSHYQPFAGIYATYMIPNVPDREVMLRQLTEAIKGVYASVFYADSKAYMTATSNVIDQEKMAVIIQEVVGRQYGDFYFPSFAGVGRSLNYYPLGEEKPGDGVAEIAVGLGKYIVDGGLSLRFSPRHPDKVLQTSTLDLALRDTQTRLYALDMSKAIQDVKVDDGFNIVRKRVQDFANTPALRYMVSTFDVNDQVIRDTHTGPGRKVVTFANILSHGVFPMAPAIDFMLVNGQNEMQRPVEIEFAGVVSPDTGGAMKGHIYWLQIRPIIDRKDLVDDTLLNIPDDELLLKSNTALGHGNIDNVDTIVYVKPHNFSSSNNPRIAREIESLNRRMVADGTGYILIGPGRWGSSDTSLGIPVKWPDISAARLIVESSLSNYRIEPSQGTHFFQNLTSFGVGYFTINPFSHDGIYDIDLLDAMPATFETDFIRV